MRGVLGHDSAVLAGIAALLAPGAEVTALVSVLPHDDAPRIPPADLLAAAYASHGLGLVEAREATRSELAAAHSSWAKRLRAGSGRPVTLLRAGARAAPARGLAEAHGGSEIIPGGLPLGARRAD